MPDNEELIEVPQLPSQPQMITPAPRGSANMVPFSQGGGLMPSTFQEAWSFAGALSNSTIVPNLFRGQQGNCFVALEYAATLRVGVVFLMNNLAFINNRATLWGDLMLAIARRHPDFESHKEYTTGQGDQMVGVCEIKRKGEELHVVKFSVQDARSADLWMNPKKDPWVKYPQRMLCLRARGWALRDKFTDALCGLMSREEAEDMPPTISEKPKHFVEVSESESWNALKDEVSKLLRDSIKVDETGNRWNTARIRAKVASFKTEAELEDYRDSLAEIRNENTGKPTNQVEYAELQSAIAELDPTWKLEPMAANQTLDAQRGLIERAKELLAELQFRKAKAEETPAPEPAEEPAQDPKPEDKPRTDTAKMNSAKYLKLMGDIVEVLGEAPKGITSIAEFDQSTAERQDDILKRGTEYLATLKKKMPKPKSDCAECEKLGSTCFACAKKNKSKKTEEPKADAQQPHGRDLFGEQK
jgi:hypothetical protein